MHAKHEKKIKIDKAVVLTRAIQKLAIELDLTQQELSIIIGPSKSTFSRLFKNDARIKDSKSSLLDPLTKEGQLAILLLRLYRNLDVIFGGNAKQSQLWLKSDNEHLQNKPYELIRSVEGLVTVVQYLDAIRGKN